jgi:hypothetical protein
MRTGKFCVFVLQCTEVLLFQVKRVKENGYLKRPFRNYDSAGTFEVLVKVRVRVRVRDRVRVGDRVSKPVLLFHSKESE